MMSLRHLALLLVLSEQFAIEVELREARDTITLSGVFACAMLLHWDPFLVIVVQAAYEVGARDLLSNRPSVSSAPTVARRQVVRTRVKGDRVNSQ